MAPVASAISTEGVYRSPPASLTVRHTRESPCPIVTENQSSSAALATVPVRVSLGFRKGVAVARVLFGSTSAVGVIRFSNRSQRGRTGTGLRHRERFGDPEEHLTQSERIQVTSIGRFHSAVYPVNNPRTGFPLHSGIGRPWASWISPSRGTPRQWKTVAASSSGLTGVSAG